MYRDMFMQKCELERNLLQTQLGVAEFSPIAFAYVRMKVPGYTANMTYPIKKKLPRIMLPM